MDNDIMLTTIDNPFNPFIDFDDWLQFDEDKGYFTNQFLARVVTSSSELGTTQQENLIAAAIEEIVEENINGMYRVVDRNSRFLADV